MATLRDCRHHPPSPLFAPPSTLFTSSHLSVEAEDVRDAFEWAGVVGCRERQISENEFRFVNFGE
jgi:hypothetical protein